MKKLPILFMFLLFSPAAHAYLDPATGSVLLGMLSALISVGVILWEKIYRAIQSVGPRSRRSSLRKDDVLIHCENASYLHLFGPLVKELSNANLNVKIVSATETEHAFFSQHPWVTSELLNKDKIFKQIMRSNSRLFVSTTPGLDILGLKKSALFKKSVHLIHSASDIHGYEMFSFDRYDAVFCSGDYQARSLRRLENLRGNTGAKRKTIVSPGLLYFDDYFSRQNNSTGNDSLLIAPTWGDISLVYQLSEQVLRAAARDFKQVILRFHPQSWVTDAKMTTEISALIADIPNITIDRGPSPFESIMKCDHLLTDISAIIFDFKLLRPNGQLYFCLTYFDFSKREGHWLPWEPFEVSFAKKYGTQIKDLSALTSFADLKTSHSGPLGKEIQNIGCAAASAADELQKLLRST